MKSAILTFIFLEVLRGSRPQGGGGSAPCYICSSRNMR